MELVSNGKQKELIRWTWTVSHDLRHLLSTPLQAWVVSCRWRECLWIVSVDVFGCVCAGSSTRRTTYKAVHQGVLWLPLTCNIIKFCVDTASAWITGVLRAELCQYCASVAQRPVVLRNNLQLNAEWPEACCISTTRLQLVNRDVKQPIGRWRTTNQTG